LERNPENHEIERLNEGQALKYRGKADLFVTQGDRKQIYGLKNYITGKFAPEAQCVVTKGRD
jgi:hypothetical protein